MLGVFLTKLNLIDNMKLKTENLIAEERIILNEALLLLNTKKLMDYGVDTRYSGQSTFSWIENELSEIDEKYL